MASSAGAVVLHHYEHGMFLLWGFHWRFVSIGAQVDPYDVFCLWLPAFYGLVSDADTTVLMAHVVLYAVAVPFAYFGALLPYIIGGFVLPLASVHVHSAVKRGIVLYDTRPASFVGPAVYGSLNAVSYLFYKHALLSEHMRYFLTILHLLL